MNQLYAAAAPTPHGYKDVQPATIVPAPAGVRLVDVREPAEFTGELGHVPGAELVPLSTVAHAAASWDKGTPVLCICRSGGRSGKAAQQLVAMGFTQVMNMSGGMLAYNQAGLPTAK